MDELAALVGYVLLGVIVAVLIGLLGGLPVWFLWNWLMPRIFELPTVTLMEAIGLSLLCSLLFKSSSSSSSNKK